MLRLSRALLSRFDFTSHCQPLDLRGTYERTLRADSFNSRVLWRFCTVTANSKRCTRWVIKRQLLPSLGEPRHFIFSQAAGLRTALPPVPYVGLMQTAAQFGKRIICINAVQQVHPMQTSTFLINAYLLQDRLSMRLIRVQFTQVAQCGLQSVAPHSLTATVRFRVALYKNKVFLTRNCNKQDPQKF